MATKKKEDDIDDKMDEVPKTYPKLEIHHVSVAAGDATIIVARDDCRKKDINKAYLIDAGTSKVDTETVIIYFNKIYSEANFNALILSHDHQDHRGGLPEKGTYFNKAGATFYYGDVIKSYFQNSLYSNTEQIHFHDTKEKVLDLLKGIKLTCYCAGGIPRGHDRNGAPFVSDLNRFNKWINIDYKEKDFKSYTAFAGLKDENDLSLAWILEYKPTGKKEFRYFTGGDLSGDKALKYTNVERALLDCLYRTDGPLKDKNNDDITIDVLKATHHGSKHSSFGYDTRKEDKDYYKEGSKDNQASIFLDKIQPKHIVLPCNNSLGEALPFSEFFDRIKPYIKDTMEKKVFVVNRFHRDVEVKNKYLKLDYDFWQKVSNISTQLVTEVNENQEEELRLIYTNRIDTKKNKNVKNKEEEYEVLPVCIVCINEDGTYYFDQEIVSIPLGEHSAVKLDKEVKKDLITLVPEEYFDFNFCDTKNKESAFEQMLRRGDVEKKDIQEIIDLFGKPNQGKRKLVSTNMIPINKYRSFLNSRNMNGVFKQINSRDSDEVKRRKVKESLTTFNQNGKRNRDEDIEHRKKTKLILE